MLVLNRSPGQDILIGDDIRVCVVRITGDRVRLGVEAPSEVPVHRPEAIKGPRNRGDIKIEAVGPVEMEDRIYQSLSDGDKVALVLDETSLSGIIAALAAIDPQGRTASQQNNLLGLRKLKQAVFRKTSETLQD